MDFNIENYILNYIFKRTDITFQLQTNQNSRILAINDFTITIPELKRSNNTLKTTILSHEISYFRHKGKIESIIENKSIILSYDLIGEAFDHLTLQRERDSTFDFTDYEVFLPVLDMKIFYFFDNLKKFIQFGFKGYNGKPFALGISHDIDRTGDSYKYRVITHFFQTIKQKRPMLLFKGLFGKNEEFNFEEIIDIEKNVNAKATWFILSHYGLKKNADYTLASKWYKKAIKLLEEEQHELGLHIPFMDLSVQNINNEFARLPASTGSGVRMHHLRGDYKELMTLFNDSKVTYDSTFGFNEVISYRFGTAVPFNPLIEEDSSFQILENVKEIPMNIMDIQVSQLDTFEKQVKTLFDILEKTGGVCVINWHNNRFNKTKYGSTWTDCYKFILNEAKERDAFIGPLKDIVGLFDNN